MRRGQSPLRHTGATPHESLEELGTAGVTYRRELETVQELLPNGTFTKDEAAAARENAGISETRARTHANPRARAGTNST